MDCARQAFARALPNRTDETTSDRSAGRRVGGHGQPAGFRARAWLAATHAATHAAGRAIGCRRGACDGRGFARRRHACGNMDVQIPYARRVFGATLRRMDLKHFRSGPHARHSMGRN